MNRARALETPVEALAKAERKWGFNGIWIIRDEDVAGTTERGCALSHSLSLLGQELSEIDFLMPGIVFQQNDGASSLAIRQES
ncbi:hypothetical protein CEXT_493691 [Caerostris extrusa]|uniref:Uncharacterized protein n=1 Tax=Caerostris extrusa TaxID=172846 RepID=A0AAV4YCF7_CAEEX|nr:hypothetical protein CEXT_493691 [Caerostris extrusa]